MKPIENPSTFASLLAFTAEMIRSKDLDPLYPVLERLYSIMNFATNEALRFTSYYLAWYNICSAVAFWHSKEKRKVVRYPFGVERRSLRIGKNVWKNIDAYEKRCADNGGDQNFLTRDWLRGDNWPQLVANYEHFWTLSQSIWGNGRWAAFKWADILKNTHHLPLAAPDMRMQFCSGPKFGLKWLYECDSEDVATLNQLGCDLRERLQGCGLTLGWEELETILCNFNSLRQGKYYIGHDIDELQERIEAGKEFMPHGCDAALWRARAECLPEEYRGELRNWPGIDKKRMKAYKETGRVLFRS